MPNTGLVASFVAARDLGSTQARELCIESDVIVSNNLQVPRALITKHASASTVVDKGPKTMIVDTSNTNDQTRKHSSCNLSQTSVYTCIPVS